MGVADDLDSGADAAAGISRIARRYYLGVGAAESVTAGGVSCGLAAAEGAGEWFRGSIVAYASQVKFAVLGVNPGPVVTAEAARQMAVGALRVLSADVAVGSTGVGGPEPSEGCPAGTVFIAVATAREHRVREYHFDADPPQVVHAAAARALADLYECCRRWYPDRADPPELSDTAARSGVPPSGA
jgi:nicotinamide-nucleotide amidase